MDELSLLLRAAQTGDQIALAAWIRRSQGEVWRLCAHLVDTGAADDLTQETFVRAWRALPGFRGEASARTWLLSIARRVCADAVRSRTRRRRLRAAVEAATVAQAASDVDHLPLVDLVAGLGHDRRAAFVLTQIVGLSYAEAGEVCGCPIGTIRSRVARARADLLGLLGDDEGTAAPSATTTPSVGPHRGAETTDGSERV